MLEMHRHDCASTGCAQPSRMLLAGLGVAAMLPPARAPAADALDPAPRRVDVHHHFFPPGYVEHMADVVGSKPSPLMTGRGGEPAARRRIDQLPRH